MAKNRGFLDVNVGIFFWEGGGTPCLFKLRITPTPHYLLDVWDMNILSDSEVLSSQTVSTPRPGGLFHVSSLKLECDRPNQDGLKIISEIHPSCLRSSMRPELAVHLFAAIED